MILECCGCSIVFFRRDYWFSEWDEVDYHPIGNEPILRPGIQTTYWPAEVARTRPVWLDKIPERDRELGALLGELYSALDADLRVLAAIGIRTAFDRASELLGVNPELGFKAKLDALLKDGRISLDEEDVLETLVDAGSAAAHRGWRPAPEELSTMMDVAESFLHRSFIVGTGIKKLRAAVPRRPRKTPRNA